MSPKKIIPVVAIVIAAAIGFSIWSDRNSERSADRLTLYGNVDIREVELAFRVPGRLQSLAYDEGDIVNAGDIIAELDPAPYRQAVAVAEAHVAQAAANLDKLQAGSRPQEVALARAAVDQARAAFTNAEREYRRQSGLLESGASSEKVRDAARAQRDETAASLAAATETLGLSEEGFRREDIAAAQADLAAAMAQQAIRETELADTRLAAPSDGTLIARLREPGSMLGSGTPVYSLSLRDPVYVRAYVDEPNLGQLAPGTAVTITTDRSNGVYQGQVGFISPRAEFTPRSVETTELRTDLVYRLRIVVSESDGGLRQGMPVTVHLPRAVSGG
jgi:HlyD family secretion protein